MVGEVLQSVWVPLVILGYILVTAVLTVVTSSRKRAIDVHNRVRECMELRRKYLSDREQAKQAK